MLGASVRVETEVKALVIVAVTVEVPAGAVYVTVDTSVVPGEVTTEVVVVVSWL